MAISQIAALTAHISFLLWELNHLADQVLQIYPPSNGDFTDSLLWQLSTMRLHHLADQVLADLPPFEWLISQIPTLTLLFHSYSESLSFGRPGLGRSTPHQMAISQIPALLWKLIHLADQVLADLPPHQMAISQIAALTAHISFLLCRAHYSESSTFGRPVLVRCNPLHQMASS